MRDKENQNSSYVARYVINLVTWLTLRYHGYVTFYTLHVVTMVTSVKITRYANLSCDPSLGVKVSLRIGYSSPLYLTRHSLTHNVF